MPFESSLERDLLVLLAETPSVRRVTEQPVRLTFSDEAKRRRSYVPDYLVERRALPGILIEVKYLNELHERRFEFRERFRAASAYARENGLRFKILSEDRIRTPHLGNIRFLSRFKQTILADDPVDEHLVATLEVLGTATPALLLEAAYDHEHNRMRALPQLWAMVRTGRIGAVLFAPLTMSTSIWVAEGGGTQWPGPHCCDHPLGEAVWRRNGLQPNRSRAPIGYVCAGSGRTSPNANMGVDL